MAQQHGGNDNTHPSGKQQQQPEKSERYQYEDADICHTILICFLVVSVIVGVSFSIAALASCEFLRYVDLQGNNATQEEGVHGWPPGVKEGTFGLLNFNPGDQGCRSYQRPHSAGPWYLTARIAGLIASAAGVGTLVVLAIELVCCRFICSRVVLVLFLIAALICQALTFVIYASPLCLRMDDVSYPCLFERGSMLSVIATGVYLFAALVACPTPKPKPLIRMLMERERRTENADPCCYCWNKRPRDKRYKDGSDHEEKEEVEAQVPVPIPPPPTKSEQQMQPRRSISSQYNPYAHGQQQHYYPDEIYTTSQMTNSVMAMPDPDDAISVPVPATNRAIMPPPSAATVAAPYHYYPNPIPPPQTSFANAEVVEDDLFFDSKTV